MRPLTRVLSIVLLGLAACLDGTTEPKTSGSSGLSLTILPGPGGVTALDSGRVVVQGPTNKTVKVTPGTTVTIDQLLPGTYTVTLQGFQGGGVAYFGQTSGVTVVVGQNTSATVTFASFRPTIMSLPAYTTDGQFVLVYSKVAAAASYVVQRSADAAFTSPTETTVAATDTSVALSIPLTGPFYMRVLAVDPLSARGVPSVAQVTTTLTSVTVSPGTGSIVAGATQQFTAVAKDAQNNTISGITFFWASSNQNVALVDQTGLATGVGGGTATISALGLGVPGGASLTVSATVPTQLAFTVQPTNAASGGAISPAVQVEIRDAAGVRVVAARDAVTLAIGTNPGSGTLSGTSTVNAVNGVATFSGLSINNAGTGYTLVASSGTLTSATSTTFDIKPAPAATQLAFVVQPSNATAGAAISPAVQVEIRDATGIRVATARDAVVLAIGINPGGGVLAGTSTVNAVNGVATFSGLSINNGGTGYTLVASSGILTGATSAAFDIAPAPAATQLAFLVQPSNATAGAAISPAIQVEIRDVAGARVGTAGNAVSLAIGTNPGGGVLSGTSTVNAVNGVATFSGLSIDFAGTGYTLVASATTLTSATSAAFNIAPGPTPTGVTLLANTAFVDYNTGLSGSEASNVLLGLQSFGLNVTPFVDVSTVGIVDATAKAKILVIPEMEVGDLTPALSAEARQRIVSFVQNGGTLMVFLFNVREAAFVNTLFGYTIARTAIGGPYPLDATAATGTPFAAGPASVPNLSATFTLDGATLPVGSKVIYANGATGAVVSVVPRGAGRIVILGWDWFDAPPKGTALEGGWLEVLRRATRF